MHNSSKFYLFLLIYFIALLIPAYWMPLFETTDARYGEIAREMLASGNFVEPFYNGIKHFHKPPFTYWINALGMFFFGVNGFGARFFGAVAAVVILIYTRKTALILSGDEETADRSVLVLASSILFLIVSRIVATDIYLVMFTIMTLHSLFSQMYVRKKTSNALFAGLYLGLGFMTKGPVIFLFTLLPFFAAKFFDRGHRHVFPLTHVFYGLVVFAAVSLPWYAYVVSINDGLLQYFLKDQTVERVTTDKFERAQPVWFFFAVFFGTFIPWIFYFFRNYRFTDKLKSGRALYLYVLAPFIVFQLSTSKLGTYLLPFFPMAAVIAAVNIDSKLIKRFGFFVLILLGAAVCAAPFLKDFLEPLKPVLIPLGVFFITSAVYLLVKGIYDRRFTECMSYMLIALLFAGLCVLPSVAPYVKGYRLLTNDIKKFDPDGRYEVLVYRAFLPVISFYMDDVKAIAYGRDRETQFQHESDFRRFLIEDKAQLMRYLRNKKELILVVRHEEYRHFESSTGYKCETISVRGGDKRAVICRSPELTN